jgi:hypothetical protein
MTYRFFVNRQDDHICVAAHTPAGDPVEFFRLAAGHPAFGWSDAELEGYLTRKLDARAAPAGAGESHPNSLTFRGGGA